MRGQLAHSILSQQRHEPAQPRRVSSEVLWICSSCHRKPGYKMRPVLDALNASLGRAGGGQAVCVCVKFCHRAVASLCAAHGAPTLWDVIDNFRLYERSVVQRARLGFASAYAVQTAAHAALLSQWAGKPAVVLPHPHGNVGGWSTATRTRPSLRGVGFIYGDASVNALSSSLVRRLARACCGAGARLYLIFSPPAADTSAGSLRFQEQPCREPDGPELQRGHECRGECATMPADDSPPWPTERFRDDTGQRRFYESERILELIDVGLVWSGGVKLPRGFSGAQFFDAHRPPTRMHWWWSHGIPTLAMQLPTFRDAAERAGYPAAAVALRTPEDVEAALRSISCAPARECLRRAALRGAAMSSPQAASDDLVRAACNLRQKVHSQLGN
ncbi:hypothetical protein AB1Y20_008468 [Prymnesium parvum]|uniref:Uncharacterized protein n=1 Tax=Prymnesium parvum TaxID=97485 RepID=A0AB34ITN4_PRYPA